MLYWIAKRGKEVQTIQRRVSAKIHWNQKMLVSKLKGKFVRIIGWILWSVVSITIR